MFSINSTPAAVQNQENSDAVMARKAGAVTNSTRKAFQDRDVNSKQNPKNIKKSPIKMHPGKVHSETVSSTPHESPRQEFCYYQPVKDEYEDIFPKEYRLNMSGVSNYLLAYAKPLVPRTEDLDLSNLEEVECPSPNKQSDYDFDRSYVNLKEDIVYEKLEEFNFSF